MKKIYIIAIIMASVGIYLLMSASKDLSDYSTFADASNTKSAVKVVGTLMLDKDMQYDPEVDPNYFSFYVKDLDGREQKVVLLDAKPQDFELSEQIVMTGKMHEEAFIASSLLLKCPSKYKDEEIYLKSDS